MAHVIGLTGGIASGKSTVARLLAARGAAIVDADQIARQVVEPGQPVAEVLQGPHLVGGQRPGLERRQGKSADPGGRVAVGEQRRRLGGRPAREPADRGEVVVDRRRG